LVEVGKPVTQKSLMKLAAHLNELQRRCDFLHELYMYGSRTESKGASNDHVPDPAETLHKAVEEEPNPWPGAVEAHSQILAQLCNQAETSAEMLTILNCLSTQMADLGASVKNLGKSQIVQHRGQKDAEMDSDVESFHTKTVDKSMLTESTSMSCQEEVSTHSTSHKARSDTDKILGLNVTREGNLFLESMRLQLDMLVHNLTLQIQKGSAPNESVRSAHLHNCDVATCGAGFLFASDPHIQQHDVGQVPTAEHTDPVATVATQSCGSRLRSLSLQQNSMSAGHLPSTPLAKTAR